MPDPKITSKKPKTAALKRKEKEKEVEKDLKLKIEEVKETSSVSLTSESQADKEPSPSADPSSAVQLESSSEPDAKKTIPQESATPQGYPVVQEAKKDKKKIFLIIFFVIAFLALFTGGVLVYRKATKKEEAPAIEEPILNPEVESESEAETESPEASPAAELKREDLKVKIANGSGVSGTAGIARDFLEGLGYQEVATGNADSYDYEETEIAIKEDKEDYLDLLMADLAEEYTLSEETSTLDEEDDFDVLVTIGEK